jgi:hypothetical protein
MELYAFKVPPVKVVEDGLEVDDQPEADEELMVKIAEGLVILTQVAGMSRSLLLVRVKVMSEVLPLNTLAGSIEPTHELISACAGDPGMKRKRTRKKIQTGIFFNKGIGLMVH